MNETLRLYAPETPDPTLDLFFKHERECPLCRNSEGEGILKPHRDCATGKELYNRGNQRMRELIKEYWQKTGESR